MAWPERKSLPGPGAEREQGVGPYLTWGVLRSLPSMISMIANGRRPFFNFGGLTVLRPCVGTSSTGAERKERTTGAGTVVTVLYYEARSTITGPCGHRHNTKEAAEKCARSFAAKHRRLNPSNAHTYWHVVSVDSNTVRRRVSEDL
jgi:hypothetical protein